MKSLTKMSYERKKRLIGLVFAIPWIIGTIFFFIEPLIQSVLFSFGKISIAANSLKIEYVGLTHYIKAFTEDSLFLPMLTDSIPKLFYQVPIVLIFSLFQALLINQKFVGRTFVRAVFFLPIIISNGIIISIMQGDAFSNVMGSNASVGQMLQSEAFTSMMRQMGISLDIVNAVTTAVNSILNLLWVSGIQTLLFLAGLQTVPVSMYEAAKIEGGTTWENFWKITFPMLGPTFVINIVYTIVDTFNDFGNGVVNYINSLAQQASFEYSAALSWVYAVIIIVILAVVYAVVNRFVYYEQ